MGAGTAASSPPPSNKGAERQPWSPPSSWHCSIRSFPRQQKQGEEPWIQQTPPNCSSEKLFWAELHTRRVWDGPSGAGLTQGDLEADEQEFCKVLGFGMRFLATGPHWQEWESQCS